MKRKRILVAINSGVFYRNFVMSKALEDLTKSHEVHLALEHSVKVKESDFAYPVQMHTLKMNKTRLALRVMDFYLTMWAYRKRSTTFPIKFNVDISSKRKILYKFLALPGIRHGFIFLSECFFGREKQIDSLLKAIKPDLIIIPSQGTDGQAVDYIKSARHFKIPTLMIINGWDNLTSKGIILYKSDFLGVWSTLHKKHAQEVHRISEEKLVLLGAPHFEKYFHKEVFDQKAFKASLGVPLDKKLILFGGCSRPVDEVYLLGLLEDAIEKGTFKDFHVIYRPHPWRNPPKNEEYLYDKNFRHVTLDPQLKDAYCTFKLTGIRSLPQNTLPDLDYYPKLFAVTDVMVAALSTILIEAALNGKPSLALAFSVGECTLKMEDAYECEHFRYLDHCKGILVCHKLENFMSQCKEVIEMSYKPDIASLLDEEMKDIVYRDTKTYAQRLKDSVDQCLAGGID
ncbi:MAG: CDP-glycerol glycerophosphotransferase family protein [Candidatus Omnitrophica bacterium]|nr:CDP-glycerol glycerophosphotransferase family protein [Candidatus Omnitrophota bacterium]